MLVEKSVFGITPDSRSIQAFTLDNEHGLRIKILEWGARVQSLCFPDRTGLEEDVLLGYDCLRDYLSDGSTFGAINGRVSGRIANGDLVVDGKQYQLETNLGAHHLHSGSRSFKKAIWEGRSFEIPGQIGVELRHTSPAREDNYPGEVQVRALYTLSEDHTFTIEINAQASQTTPLNITWHPYFNLEGQGAGTIAGHQLMVNGSQRLDVDEEGVPTGKLLHVHDTSWDLQSEPELGPLLQSNPLLFDNTYIIGSDGKMKKAALLTAPISGRCVEVHTTLPALHVYTGNHLQGLVGKEGVVYARNQGISLEAMYYPDSVHHENFPSVLFGPGRSYHQKTTYRFSNI